MTDLETKMFERQNEIVKLRRGEKAQSQPEYDEDVGRFISILGGAGLFMLFFSVLCLTLLFAFEDGGGAMPFPFVIFFAMVDLPAGLNLWYFGSKLGPQIKSTIKSWIEKLRCRQ